MLRAFRSMAGKVAAGVVAVLMLVFVITSVDWSQVTGGASSTVGEIGGVKIPLRTYQQLVQNQMEGWQWQNSRSPSAEEVEEIRNSVWEQLIQQQSLDAEYRRRGISVSTDEIAAFHPDASTHVDRTLQLIRNAGCKAGLAFNPAASLDVLEWVIDKVDLVLIMSVNPGFGGQSFIDSALRKIEQARKRIEASGKDIRLEVDGGIKADNIRRVADAGADTFVAGSAIFGKPDYKAVIDDMRKALA